MDRVLISIIVPIYNTEQYLEKCIESIINQSYQSLDIILINDGSSDGSLEICRRYENKDKRIRVIDKENEGLVVTRKLGVGLSKGEYVTFVDSDDWLDKDTYENISKYLINNIDMIAYGLTEEYSERQNKQYNQFKEGLYNKEKIQDEIIGSMICKDMFFQFGILPNLVCKIAKKNIWEKAYENVSDIVTIGEDADCTYQMLIYINSLQILSDCPYHYRKYNESMMAKKVEMDKCVQVIRDLKAAFIKSGRYEAVSEQLYKYCLFLILLKCTEKILEFEYFNRDFFAKKIVIYGAGGFGRQLYDLYNKNKKIEIVGWVDSAYKEYQKQGMSVESIDGLGNIEYDKIIIAVLNEGICKEIKGSLLDKGLDDKKIIYICPDEELLNEMKKLV